MDSTLGEAHTSLAQAVSAYDFDFERADREFRRGIELSPNYATGHQWYAESGLAALGRFDEAIAEMKRALELDPLSVIINADVGTVLCTAGRYDEAIEQLRKTLEMDPDFYYAHWNLGQALELKGRTEEAIAEYQKAATLNDDPLPLALLGRLYGRMADEKMKRSRFWSGCGKSRRTVTSRATISQSYKWGWVATTKPFVCSKKPTKITTDTTSLTSKPIGFSIRCTTSRVSRRSLRKCSHRRTVSLRRESPNFFAELKRRNVYKVAVAYAVVAWLLIQVATQVFPFFEIPNWAIRLVVLLLALGFPIAVILAWAFELTPEGIKRTEDVSPNESKAPRTGNKLSAIIVLFALIAGGLLIYQFTRPKQITLSSTAGIDSKSVAVLPFENLSSDKENAFFAQGIQDEIITTLSKIGGLRVISRTSTARYESKPENLSQIARELGVANLLEGSVQKSGGRVHINVQLIHAETDSHLWAQSFDRELTDIFTVEGEVAKKIADSLRATLSPQEKARVETKPTDNTDAYVLYLRGREYQTRPDNYFQDFQNASQLFEQAIALDPNFALAHARLAAVTCNIYHWFEPTGARKEKARREALESLRLQPNLGEGHAALGLYLYYTEADYAGALRELDLATLALPNDGDVGLYIAAIKRRQGRWDEAIAAYERAEAVDPRNQVTLYDASQTYFGLRDWNRALHGLDRVLELAPDAANVKIQRGYIEFFWKGSTAPIKAALKSIPADVDPDGAVTFNRWDASLMDRDPAAAERALAACGLESINSQQGVSLPKSYLRGCINLVRQDNARAQVNFEAARPALEKVVADSPQDAMRHGQLGLLYAFMGRKEDALREGRRAVELKPISRDVIDGSLVQGFQALIYARVGETDKAISELEHLLTTPFAVDYADESITLSDLRTRWQWDPLRNDPRFQKILAGPEPKTIR